MFSTFVTYVDAFPHSRDDSNEAQSLNEPTSTQSANYALESSTGTRPKRKQVPRACDWCRAHRVKCDAFVPCRNCQSRGGHCSNRGQGGVRSLPQALREIEQLHAKVRKLEADIATQQTEEAPVPSSPTLLHTSASTLSQAKDGGHKVLLRDCSHSTETSRIDKDSTAQLPCQDGQARPWMGVYSRIAHSHTTCYYGPASLFYFISRINTFLAKELHQSHPDHHLQPNVPSRTLSYPSSLEGCTDDLVPNTIGAARSLSRSHEEHFLALFWNFYQWAVPILDEQEFRSHYESLWDPSGTTRQPSPIVDIVLALCMQYGLALLPKVSQKIVAPGEDSTVAGRWFYKRCQARLAREQERPTTTSLQCQIFSVIYLSCASFQNMAHSTLSTAIRTAQTLGLHMDPPYNMDPREREKRRRLWWVLSTIESKCSMKLGRPFSFSLYDATCLPPSDDQETASVAAPSLAVSGTDVTWLSYITQHQKLNRIVRTIYTAMYDEFTGILGQAGAQTPYEEAELLEAGAVFLRSKLPALDTWVQDVPEGLKTRRRGLGEPLALDRSPLDIESQAPLWLQRQRICLELLYHNHILNLYRPFITFSRRQGMYRPISEGHATACINHAITHTNILHQVLSETDLLNGWHEAFQWQWNVAMTMVGFLLAYPLSPSGPAVRRAADKSIVAFELFGANNVAVAESAAEVAREVIGKADYLVNTFRAGFSGPILDQAPVSRRPDEDSGSIFSLGLSPGLATAEGSEFFDFLDSALAVDSFNSFDSFYTGLDESSAWAFDGS